MSVVTAIRFAVSVPVLSVQMTVTEPSDSTAGNRGMSAWRFNIRWAPSASAMVTTAGKPSGTTATAMLTAVKNIKRISSPRSSPKTKMSPMIASDATAMERPKRSRRR
jgi:hypothetical protein